MGAFVYAIVAWGRVQTRISASGMYIAVRAQLPAHAISHRHARTRFHIATRARIHKYTHARANAHRHARAFGHAYTHTGLHIALRAHSDTHTRTRDCTSQCARIRIRIHAHGTAHRTARAFGHAYTHTGLHIALRAHSDTHTRTRDCTSQCARIRIRIHAHGTAHRNACAFGYAYTPAHGTAHRASVAPAARRAWRCCTRAVRRSARPRAAPRSCPTPQAAPARAGHAIRTMHSPMRAAHHRAQEVFIQQRRVHGGLDRLRDPRSGARRGRLRVVVSAAREHAERPHCAAAVRDHRHAPRPVPRHVRERNLHSDVRNTACTNANRRARGVIGYAQDRTQEHACTYRGVAASGVAARARVAGRVGRDLREGRQGPCRHERGHDGRVRGQAPQSRHRARLQRSGRIRICACRIRERISQCARRIRMRT